MRAISLFRLLLGTGLAANGFTMLAVPETWYLLMPGVAATGPLNLHFVRDIGCAYLVSGVSLMWLARDARKWPAAIAGTAFLLLHAGVHVGEAVAGTLSSQHLARDLPGVFLFPFLALWLSWPRRTDATKENFDVTMDRTAAARRL